MGVEPLDIVKAVLMLIAGLGTFLIGLKVMGENLETLAGDRLKVFFTKISDNKLLGIATGAVTTVLTQSSTATTVMVVGFVNTGVMTLIQATAIIMGANIGTTITAYLIALQKIPVAAAFSALAGAGVFMQMAKNNKVKDIGTIFTGVGMLFIGLYVMSNSMSIVTVIKTADGSGLLIREAILRLAALPGAPIILLVFGAILTIIVQSSAGTTAILVGLCSAGAMDLEPALYITLGMNVGTCLTALVSSAGASTNAKRASMIHLLFNVIGTIIFGIVLAAAGKYILQFITSIRIGSDEGTVISMQIALFHTIFNVTTTIVLFPLMKQFTQLASLIIPESKIKKVNPQDLIYKFKYLDDRFLNTPSIAMAMLRKEIFAMMEDSQENLQLSINAIMAKDLGRIEEFQNRETHINFINKEITKYMVNISNLDITYANEQEIAAYYHNVSDIERIGDYAENVIEYAQELIKAGVDFSEPCKEEITDMTNAVYQELNAVKIAFDSRSLKDYNEIIAYEDLVDTYYNKLSENHIVRLNQGSCNAEAGSIFISLIGNLERIGDHAMNVAKSMTNYLPLQ
ncbi:MAG: Na/Pi cotransporter family protein [Clostridia bacterium]|nr:Na/Pi cotransporter family protein [Clostridia bacterium]